jgi:hypothetical protein
LNATKTKKRKSPNETTAKHPTEHPLLNRLRSHLLRNFNHDGHLRVRHLWTSENVHRFRANWWKEAAIVTSLFLRVQEGMDGELSVEAV